VCLQSIVRNEILPAMKKNPNYLAQKGMERHRWQRCQSGDPPETRSWQCVGRVKFLFPNSYSIYFHDTPSKGGFARESRAFSHGCIRLSEPKELAEYLLRNDTTWTTGEDQGGHEQGQGDLGDAEGKASGHDRLLHRLDQALMAG
jgi:murein L,D-transpeptidase YcbB/YkuD